MAKAIHKLLQAIEDLENAFVLLPAQMAESTRQHQQTKNEERDLIPPQPQPRKRRLTLPLPSHDTALTSLRKNLVSTLFPSPYPSPCPSPSKCAQSTLPQPQSPLLSLLPLELRIHIYKLVICAQDRGRLDISSYKPKPRARDRQRAVQGMGKGMWAARAKKAKGKGREESRERPTAYWEEGFGGGEGVKWDWLCWGEPGRVGVLGLLVCCRIV